MKAKGALFAFGFLWIAGAAAAQDPADLILVNAQVITMDPAIPRAEAIALRGDRIVAVGDRAAIETYRGQDTQVLDLEGATAVPGLIDAHMHFSRLGKRTRTLFLDETKTPAEAAAIVAERARRAPPGTWITGEGWHTVYWNTRDDPDHRLLTEAAPHHPVYLVGMASHAAWVNEEALRRAGITRVTPDPPGGEIVKNPETGEPTGILLETAADLVENVLPGETRASLKRDVRLSHETALRLGLTSVHDAGVGREEIEIYRELVEGGHPGVRLYVMFRAPDAGPALDDFLRDPPLIDRDRHRLAVRAVKAFADGALGARGAALLEPYQDSPGDRGLLPLAPEEIDALVLRCMQAGYQVAVHAIGDRGNRLVLDAIEKAQRALGLANARARIEHAQVLAPADIPRFARLGVIASMQPIHAPMDMGFAGARLGPERVRGAYAWRSLLDAGATIAASADTPSFPVKYSNPLWGIHAAVTRQDMEGSPPGGWHPEQRVTPQEALAMYTIDAAYAAFEEEIKGSLTPGKLADVTVLSRNILEIPPEEIPKTEVLMTLVGGRVLYRKSLGRESR